MWGYCLWADIPHGTLPVLASDFAVRKAPLARGVPLDSLTAGVFFSLLVSLPLDHGAQVHTTPLHASDPATAPEIVVVLVSGAPW